METSLQNILPLFSAALDCLVSKQGDITIAFEVHLPVLFTMSDAEQEILHHALLKAIRSLPSNSVLHKQDWFTEAKFTGDFERPHTFLSEASERFFNERPYLDHRCYLMLTRKPTGRRASSSLFSTLIRKTLVPLEAMDPKWLEQFESHAGQFVKLLEDTGMMKLRRLTNVDLTGDHLKPGIIEQYVSLEQHQRLLQDVSFDDGIQVGPKQLVLMTLADAIDLPDQCASSIPYDKYSTDQTSFPMGFTTSLGQLLPCNHIYNQYIFIDDAPATLKRLESKRLRLQSLSNYSRENAIARDAVNAFLNEAMEQQRLPVKAHFNVMAWTEDKSSVNDIRNLIASAFSRMNATPKQEIAGAPQIYWAGVPGNAADFPLNDTFDCFAEQAACFLHVESNDISAPTTAGLRLGERRSGRPLHVDLSDAPMAKGIITNRNKFILGPSGSGKSFFTNHMVRSYFEQGTHVVLVDVGHSYKGLCSLVQGYYFTYEEKKPVRFNPFTLGENEKPDTEKKESIKTLLLALWKKDTEPFRRSEYVALSNALQLYYDADLAERSFDTFYDFLSGEFVEVLKHDRVREKDFDIDNFLFVLRPFYRGGEFNYLLNATENLDLLNQRFIVFELDNIKDHPILFPVVTIIIMEVFISKMRRLKGIRKMILIEEAWKAIAKEGMAEYIKYLFKTVRKFYGEAIVVTQDIEDIISSPIVKQAIINNADCKILLDQSKYLNKFDQIQQLLGLTEKEKTQVLSINKDNDPALRYKEVFISLGGVQSRVYRVEVSPEEYYTYSTEEKEKVRLMAMIEGCGGDMEEAIRRMVRETRQ